MKRKDEEITRLRSELRTRDEEERREMEKINADLEALKKAYLNNQ